MLQVIGSIHKGIRAVFEHAYCAIAPVAQQAPDCTSGVTVIGGQSPWVPVRSYGSLRLFADRAYLALLFHKPVVMLWRHAKALLSSVCSEMGVQLGSIVDSIFGVFRAIARLAPSLKTIIGCFVFVEIGSRFLVKAICTNLVVFTGCDSYLACLTVAFAISARFTLSRNKLAILKSISFRYRGLLPASALAISCWYLLFHHITIVSWFSDLAYCTTYYQSTTIEV